MPAVEIALSVSSLVAGAVSVAFVAYLIRTSGRDRPNDPSRLARFIQNAPRDGSGDAAAN